MWAAQRRHISNGGYGDGWTSGRNLWFKRCVHGCILAWSYSTSRPLTESQTRPFSYIAASIHGRLPSSCTHGTHMSCRITPFFFCQHNVERWIQRGSPYSCTPTAICIQNHSAGQQAREQHKLRKQEGRQAREVGSLVGRALKPSNAGRRDSWDLKFGSLRITGGKNQKQRVFQLHRNLRLRSRKTLPRGSGREEAGDGVRK